MSLIHKHLRLTAKLIVLYVLAVLKVKAFVFTWEELVPAARVSVCLFVCVCVCVGMFI